MRPRMRWVTALVAALGLTLAACGGSDDGDTTTDQTSTETEATTASETDTSGDDTAAGGDESVVFGYVEWPGVTVKTAVAAEIVKELGYSAERKPLTVPIVLEGLASGDLSAFLGVWRPSMDSMVDPKIESGDVEIIGTNLEDTVYQNAVPSFVAEELGVSSMEDLDANREAFDGKIYGIEPGNDGNQTVEQMINDDTYGLGDWELVESSTNAMLQQVSNAAESKEPIVFLGWEPHWMNLEYDITYLEDPENVWGGRGHVETAVHTGFADENPNIGTLLSQMKVEKDWQSSWISALDKEGKEAENIARSWISEHLSDIEPWLEGVVASDGTPAAEKLQAAFG